VDDRTLEDAKDLLFEALELDDSARRALLDARCADRPRLRERVESLLAAHGRSPAMLTGDGARPFAPGAGRLGPGARLGPYRIVREAGAGGFGTVYEAEQEQPVRRRVALKLLHRGLDAPEARARFDAERQALARMDHPHIARVYDAGTTPEGRPWFAMEYVEGVPLNEFAAEGRLDLEQRLALFRQVCLAIQHAHQKGVVHRDLKPSNVLVGEVDGVPAPKVIDFGVAKAVDGPLTAEAVRTQDGQWIGTPAYMSPEQAAGEADVDTRSDVYGLGVMLYELLTSRPPFALEGAGLATLLDTIARVEPRRPSEVAPAGVRLPPDLDWITLRCLEKERARRYSSAQALADDVRRFLEGLPVEAAPPSTWYRLVKLTRRHSLAVGAAALVALALAVGGVGTAIGWMRADRANTKLGEALELARQEAEHARLAELEAREQADVARAVNDFVNVDLLSSAVPSVEPGKGRDVPLRSVLDAASRGIEGAGAPGGRFEGKPLVEASIRDMLGDVYGKLGEYSTAVAHLRRALELFERHAGPEAPETQATRLALSATLRVLGRGDESAELLLETLESQRAALGPDAEPTLLTQWQLALALHVKGHTEAAYELLGDAWLRVQSAGLRTTELGAGVLGGLAIAAHQSGHDEEALEAFEASHATLVALRGAEDPDTLSALVNLATFLRSLHRYEEAQTRLEAALALMRDVLGPEHSSTLATLYNLGAVLLERGRYAEAEEVLAEALDGQARVLGPSHPHTVSTRGALGVSLQHQGRLEEAEDVLREALDLAERDLGRDHPISDARRRDLARLLGRDPQRRAEARELLEASLESQERAQGPAHPAVVSALLELAALHVREGDTGEAEGLLREALERSRSARGERHVEGLQLESELADVLRQAGRAEEALPFAEHALRVGEETLPADDAELARFRLRLGLVLRDAGRGPEGRREVERARAALEAALGPADDGARLAADALDAWDA